MVSFIPQLPQVTQFIDQLPQDDELTARAEVSGVYHIEALVFERRSTG